MPELPEVQTTVDGLRKTVVGLSIRDVWTDLAVGAHMTPHLRESLKDKKFFARFKKLVVGAKIISAERRAKNILINLSNKHTILIHMKMTGHLMVGKYENTSKVIWEPSKNENNEALRDPYNKFLHVVFTLSDGKHLVLSDVRKFAKVTIVPTKDLPTSIHIGHLGPEPLEKTFTFPLFKARLDKRSGSKIKEVLMDQSIIAGIGNIYSDEMLWESCIHPLSIVKKIPSDTVKKLFTAMKSTLKKGIDFGGDSTSDYRDVYGKKGTFQGAHNAYRLTGKSCKKPRCHGAIKRIVVGGRSAHFCPVHQKLFT